MATAVRMRAYAAREEKKVTAKNGNREETENPENILMQ